MVFEAEIRAKLRTWYLTNRRQLPWRETTDPYRIWVSEIILQQTRVEQGLEFYARFLERFPDLESLARSDEEAVLKIWQGLGYYSRARHMLEAARQVSRTGGGKLPGSYAGLLALKGTGPYTAAAVSSIAFGEPRAVVDGNVHRVLSRIYGIAEVPGAYHGSSAVAGAAEELLDREEPGIHNQAVMELGARICTPRNPGCPSCPLRDYCLAFREGRIEEFPPRATAPLRRKRYFNYLVARNGQCQWMAPRRGKDIWQGLYEFPLIETRGEASTVSLRRTRKWKELFPGKAPVPAGVWGPVRHILSHQEIHAWFHRLPAPEFDSLPGYEKVCPADLERYPVPKLISNYLDRLSN